MNLISKPSAERTLLVIASDRANMQLMTQLIARRDDLKLLTAVNGKEGMQLADASLPEVVVLDTSLSDICAGEVLKGMQGNPLTSHIPVIAVSSDAMPAHVEAGLQAGFYRYLTKLNLPLFDVPLGRSILQPSLVVGFGLCGRVHLKARHVGFALPSSGRASFRVLRHLSHVRNEGVLRLAESLAGVCVLLNCAGSFAKTVESLVRACI